MAAAEPTGRYTTTRGGCRQNDAKDAQSALDAKWNCDCDWLRCIGPVLACRQRRRLQQQQVASARDCDGDCGMFYKWFSCSECVMFLGKDFFGPLLSWPSRGSWRVVMCVRKHETFKCTNEASGKWQVAGGASGKQQSSKWQEVVDMLRLFGSCSKMPSMPPLLPADPATRWSPHPPPAPAHPSSSFPASAPAQHSQVNCQSHKTS